MIAAKRRDSMSAIIEEVFSAILSFREATDAFSLRMERRFDGVDARLDDIGSRLNGHDQLDGRTGRIETRIEHFEDGQREIHTCLVHLEDGQREIRNKLVEMNQRFLG